ncbi:MAG: hypothetical protein GX892_08755 [Thermoanaerobacteraceae bacterium]|nr:hypothetical protein [Thermoanaerobacteraceae bacterium]
MADIRDFFSRLGNESTASMAYLLLMANVLGLAAYFEGKKNVKSFAPKPENTFQKDTLTATTALPTSNEKATNQIVEPASSTDDKKTIQNVTDKIEQNLADNIEKEKAQKKHIEPNQVEATIAKNKEEQTKTRDNIINFKEAVASRAHEPKKPLEPLVWRFPKG